MIIIIIRHILFGGKARTAGGFGMSLRTLGLKERRARAEMRTIEALRANIRQRTPYMYTYVCLHTYKYKYIYIYIVVCIIIIIIIIIIIPRLCTSARHATFAARPRVELYYTILCYAILYCTILCYAILYCTILYYTMLCYTILYYTILYFTTLYYTILYYATLYYTIV